MEALCPTAYAEDFDNVGLLVGLPQMDVTGILVTHDCTEDVVKEAISRGCNMIVAFHPIIFSGLKKITGSTYVERAVMCAIRHDIAIYACHTSLDNDFMGVNEGMCRALGLLDKKILLPQPKTMYKLTTYVPVDYLEKVRNAIFEAGGGHIGDYDQCSCNLHAEGTFCALDGAEPFVGKKGEFHTEKEVMMSCVVPSHVKNDVVKALLGSHPYEEPAYDVVLLDNANLRIGMGMTGFLPSEMEEMDFLHLLKERFGANGIRYSALRGKKIHKVAVLGGSGSFATRAAIRSGADAFVSADFKYHDFFGAENRILIADIGHFESERFTKNILSDYLCKKFTNFAVCLSNIDTNPINYLQ